MVSLIHNEPNQTEGEMDLLFRCKNVSSLLEQEGSLTKTPSWSDFSQAPLRPFLTRPHPPEQQCCQVGLARILTPDSEQIPRSPPAPSWHLITWSSTGTLSSQFSNPLFPLMYPLNNFLSTDPHPAPWLLIPTCPCRMWPWAQFYLRSFFPECNHSWLKSVFTTLSTVWLWFSWDLIFAQKIPGYCVSSSALIFPLYLSCPVLVSARCWGECEVNLRERTVTSQTHWSIHSWYILGTGKKFIYQVWELDKFRESENCLVAMSKTPWLITSKWLI